MLSNLTRRPIEPADQEFLYRVYASTRADELAVVPWTDEQKEEFLRMQFHAQHTFYHAEYPNTQFELLMLNGEPAGRIYVERRDDEIRIMDIALLPEHRGAGIGTALIREVMDEAAAKKVPVNLHVEAYNPAFRLYTRLGFVKIGGDEIYTLMEWRPEIAPDV